MRAGCMARFDCKQGQLSVASPRAVTPGTLALPAEPHGGGLHDASLAAGNQYCGAGVFSWRF